MSPIPKSKTVFVKLSINNKAVEVMMNVANKLPRMRNSFLPPDFLDKLEIIKNIKIMNKLIRTNPARVKMRILALVVN